MATDDSNDTTNRLGASAPTLAPRLLFSKETGIVPTMIQAASQAKIEGKTLRRNISVLEGSGGNIAVLTGKDGKPLVDAGFTVSRPRIAAALDRLSADPTRGGGLGNLRDSRRESTMSRFRITAAAKPKKALRSAPTSTVSPEAPTALPTSGLDQPCTTHPRAVIGISHLSD